MDNFKRFMRQNWRRYLLNLVLAGGVYGSSTWYAMTNHATANVHILQTAFDRWVPVIPQFIVPYNWLEPVLYFSLLFFFVFHPKIFTAFAVAFIALEAISNGVYIVFQTQVPRPTNLVPGSSKYVDELLETYKTDNPYNCFPSLHCGLSALAASFWWVKRRYWPVAWLMTLFAAVTIIATQVLKQHVIVDTVGSLLAVVLFLVAYRIFDLKTEV
ncbi:MAG: phosphatase PAP2 family protein [Candidatus Cryosericum sp.]|nr:phosphatase PAP2 family protein [bacterium]